jgi:hypothetical protein
VTSSSIAVPCLRAGFFGIALALLVPVGTFGQGKPAFNPGNLVVSRSVYDNLPGNVTVGQTLPPNCDPSHRRLRYREF